MSLTSRLAVDSCRRRGRRCGVCDDCQFAARLVRFDRLPLEERLRLYDANDLLARIVFGMTVDPRASWWRADVVAEL